MKFLHIIQLNEKNSYNLFKQLNEMKTDDEHIFFVCNYKRMVAAFPKFYEFKNFLYINEKDSHIKKAWNFFKLLYSADHIILNSLIFNSNLFLYFLYVFRFFLKKSTWIEWGGDLYNWKQAGTTFKDKILNHVNFVIRKKVKYIGLTFEGDAYFYKSEFKENKIFFFTPLVFGDGRIDLIEKAKSESTDFCATWQNKINIQIAHNSYPDNNHQKCIKEIEKFEENNINIFIPLSYGDYVINGIGGGSSYKEKVTNYAIEVFGEENISILKHNVRMEEYLNILWGVDVAIFGSVRPIGLANIIYLLYMNKKVFLPGESPHYKFFKSKGLNVHMIEKIKHMTFDEFVENPQNTDNKYIIERLTFGNDIKHWIHFFDFVKGVSK